MFLLPHTVFQLGLGNFYFLCLFHEKKPQHESNIHLYADETQLYTHEPKQLPLTE